MWLGMWMTSYPEAMGWGFWGIFEKKAVSWDPKLGELSWDYGVCTHLLGQWVEIWNKRRRVDFRIWTRWVDFWAGRGQSSGLRDASRIVGSDETVSIVKIVSLTRVENLKIKKVIKVFYLNYQESSVSRDSYTYERFTDPYTLHICTFHIFVLWVCYNPKAPFSIVTTPKCREGHYSFPWIVRLYLWSIPYNVEC